MAFKSRSQRWMWDKGYSYLTLTETEFQSRAVRHCFESRTLFSVGHTLYI